ncbi:MAG: YbaK/EbsC family protein, partial [Candidatus Competibacterales bacterium]
GSLTPLAVFNDPDQRVKVVFDEGVLDADPVIFHPLDNTATLALNPRDLLAFIRSLGHEPRLATMPLVPPPSL